MSKFFNDRSARCTACGTYLTLEGLARNDRHLYPVGMLYGCECGASKVWTNSIRNEKALLAHYATGSRYFQGFCNDLFDGEGREIMPWRSVAVTGEYQRGQIYGTYEDYKLFEAEQGPDSTLIVWSGRFWPEVEGSQELIDEYANYVEQILSIMAPRDRIAPLRELGVRFNPDDGYEEESDELTAEILWDARGNKIQQLPFPPSLADVKAIAAPKDVVPLVDILGVMGRFPTSESLSMRELKTYMAQKISGARFKGLVSKYGAFLAGTIGKSKAVYRAGEQVESGRGAFGRLGGSRLRSGYNPAFVMFK